MSRSVSRQKVLRDAAAVIDEHQLVRLVGQLNPDWRELERYSAPLPSGAVRALETAADLWSGHPRVQSP